MSGLAAIILAGGRATRLGGADKPRLVIGGMPLIEHAVAAARALGADRTIVVGPPGVAGPDVHTVREDPPFGGPVAAVGAGLTVTDAPLVLLLAADLPQAEAAVERLRPWLVRLAADDARDGAILVDADGRDQWLAGVYRSEALRGALDRLDRPVDGASLRALVGGLALARVPDEGTAADVDTWADVARLGTLEGDGVIADDDHEEAP